MCGPKKWRHQSLLKYELIICQIFTLKTLIFNQIAGKNFRMGTNVCLRELWTHIAQLSYMCYYYMAHDQNHYTYDDHQSIFPTWRKHTIIRTNAV
jgi:hypothetical protein